MLLSPIRVYIRKASKNVAVEIFVIDRFIEDITNHIELDGANNEPELKHGPFCVL